MISDLRHFLRRLQPFGSWLGRGRLIAVFWVVVAGSLGAGLYTGTEAAMKWAAAWLQVLGSVVVVFNNMGTQRRIGIDPIWVRMRRWFKTRPPILSGVPVFRDIQADGAFGNVTATGYLGSVEAGIDPAELRLRQIERDIFSVREQLNATTKAHAEELEVLRQALEAEKAALLEVRRTAENARGALADSIDLSTIGTGWLVVGIFVGMFPAEITALTAWLHPHRPPVWTWFGAVR